MKRGSVSGHAWRYCQFALARKTKLAKTPDLQDPVQREAIR
jgi:hypothetical protein